MKVAVVLTNLGGPDSLAAVRPFLFNLFSDKAILALPFFLRLPLAQFIAARREKEAQHIYAAIGGRSPLLENTKAQAHALENALNAAAPSPLRPTASFKTFTVMRYWHPRAAEVVEEIKNFSPDRVIVLPLYPQFSASTTQSSLDDLEKALRGSPLAARLLPLCCYPTLKGFINAQAALIRSVYDTVGQQAKDKGCTRPPRILFSAHGLPEKNIRAGDPYQAQCEATVRSVVAALAMPGLDYCSTYQSRVGPLKWIGPYTDAEIERAGAEGVPLVIVPIAFVSEHSETLYEIEQQYRTLAEEKDVPAFGRVPAVGTHPLFIEGLKDLVLEALTRPQDSASSPFPMGGLRLCASSFGKCACKA